MATLSDCSLHSVGIDERVCIFCGERIINGAMWSTGIDNRVDVICVGNCCKRHLIDMYKDVILDEVYEDLFHFKERIQRDIKECYNNELKRQLDFENRKIKEAVDKKLKYEYEIRALEKNK